MPSFESYTHQDLLRIVLADGNTYRQFIAVAQIAREAV